MSDERSTELKDTIKSIRGEHGTGSVMNLGATGGLDVETLPTGSLALDKALQVGGLPKNRIVEIFGRESTGKTSVALHIMAEAQKQGGLVAFIDAEHALDPTYAKALGVDPDKVYLSQPDSGEQALDIVDQWCKSDVMDLIVVDSVAALAPEAELEGDVGDANIGLQARLMSQTLRRLKGTSTTLIFLNQVRSNINTGYGGASTVTPGGKALKFYSSVRIELWISKTIDGSDNEKQGNRVTANVVKNKVAAPFRKAQFDIMYGEGISHERELVNLGAEHNIVERKGAWYKFEPEGEKEKITLGQGKANATEYLKENPDTTETIEKQLRQELFQDED